MKILYLIPYLPTPPDFGGALRMYHILKHLVAHHEVTVAGFSEYGDRVQFEEAFPELIGHTHFLQRKWEKYHRLNQLLSLFTSHSYWYNWAQSAKLEKIVRRLVRRGQFDFIIGEFATMGHFDLDTDAVRILDAHNVEYDNFRRMRAVKGAPLHKWFYNREYKKCYSEEVQAFKRHDALFVTSRRDGELIKEDAPAPRQYVIPNGVQMDYFYPSKTEQEPFSIVFTGAMEYLPNNDGMIYFLEAIFPIIQKRVPQAKVYVVGKNPPPALRKYQSDSVTITGFVEDVRPYVDQAKVFVVPLNMGSGTRLKVVEALAMKKPVVSTSIGCEGIDVENEKHLLIRDDPAAFAEAVISLFEDRDLRERLITNGYELVKQHYDWSVIGQSIDQALSDLISQKRYNLHTNGVVAEEQLNRGSAGNRE